MGSATSNTRGLESTMHAKNPPPTASPSLPVVRGSRGEPPATADARSSSAPAADGVEALGSQEPPPPQALAGPPSRVRRTIIFFVEFRKLAAMLHSSLF